MQGKGLSICHSCQRDKLLLIYYYLLIVTLVVVLLKSLQLCEQKLIISCLLAFSLMNIQDLLPESYFQAIVCPNMKILSSSFIKPVLFIYLCEMQKEEIWTALLQRK